MTRRTPQEDASPTPVTRPDGKTTAALQWAPAGVRLARLLAEKLFAARLRHPERASRLGELARECERLADSFESWSRRLGHDRMFQDQIAWQEVQARAREMDVSL